MLIEADADEGITTDQLMEISGLGPEGVRGALYDLERLGIASNDTVLTAFVHAGVERASPRRLQDAAELETALISHMREAAPDQGKGDTSSLHLRIASQILRDQGLTDPLPERLWRVVRGIAYDGRGEDGAAGSLTVRKLNAETVRVTLRREWRLLEETASIRRHAAGRLLDHLLACLPPGSRGTDLLAETTLGKLTRAIESDLILRSRVRRPDKLLDRALMWLHEQEVIRLNKGLAVFRPAMAIRLEHRERRGFAKADFEPLALHYNGQVLQIHVMAEFAKRGLAAMSEALGLAMDYFTLGEEAFLARWLPERDKEIGRQTTPESWRKIVENLKNPVQQHIVADDRGGDQCAGAGRSRLGQDAGAGASDRLPDTRTPRERPGHPGPGLQPSRGGRYPAAPPGVDRRRCARRDRAHLPRPGDAVGRSQLHGTGGASGRRSVPGGDPSRGGLAAREGPSGGGGGREAGTPLGRLPLDPGGRVPGHRGGPI